MKLISGSLKFAGYLTMAAATLGAFVRIALDTAGGSLYPAAMVVALLSIGWALGCLGKWWRARDEAREIERRRG